jgi:hypothetical protein
VTKPVLFVSIVFSLSLSGCASAHRAGEKDTMLITEAEIASSGAETAYDAVKILRGNFLSYRGKTTLLRDSTSSSMPVVYLDDQEFGPILTLKTIPASHVTLIRLYRSWEATTKYGTGKVGGVIAVETKH